MAGGTTRGTSPRPARVRGGGTREARALAAVALTLGLSATAACASGTVRPTAPSPGLQAGGSVAPVAIPPTVKRPGVSAPGIKLSVVPRSDGSFDATEVVVLRSATGVLPLRLPDSGQRLQGMMARTNPQAANLRVVADGQPVKLDRTSLDAPRDLLLVTAATKVTLTYRLTGSTVRRLPSRAGRAAAAIRPLTFGTDGTLPTDLLVSGGGLLNATCPRLAETRCAVGEPPRLGIQQGIPAERALAVLQLDLPTTP